MIESITLLPEKYETLDDFVDALFWEDMYIVGDNLDYILDVHNNRVYTQLGYSYTSLADRYNSQEPIVMCRLDKDIEDEFLEEYYEE